MQKYSKAIAAFVAALVAVLAVFNIDVSEEVQGAIIVLATTVVTLAAPKNADRV